MYQIELGKTLTAIITDPWSGHHCGAKRTCYGPAIHCSPMGKSLVAISTRLT